MCPQFLPPGARRAARHLTRAHPPTPQAPTRTCRGPLPPPPHPPAWAGNAEKAEEGRAPSPGLCGDGKPSGCARPGGILARRFRQSDPKPPTRLPHHWRVSKRPPACSTTCCKPRTPLREHPSVCAGPGCLCPCEPAPWLGHLCRQGQCAPLTSGEGRGNQSPSPPSCPLDGRSVRGPSFPAPLS